MLYWENLAIDPISKNTWHKQLTAHWYWYSVKNQKACKVEILQYKARCPVVNLTLVEICNEMCHYYWNRVRRIGVELLSEFAFVLKKMLFSIHKICIEIEDYITTVWNPEQNVESINTIYQNSVLKSSTYQKWMSNTVKALRRRMAAPCCFFLFLWVTLRKVSSCLLSV